MPSDNDNGDLDPPHPISDQYVTDTTHCFGMIGTLLQDWHPAVAAAAIHAMQRCFERDLIPCLTAPEAARIRSMGDAIHDHAKPVIEYDDPKTAH